MENTHRILLERLWPKVSLEQAPYTITAHYPNTYSYFSAGISIILAYYVW